MPLVVFDLDFTLWDCGGLWIDCTDPPFQIGEAEGTVEDGEGRIFSVYPDVPEILDEFEEQGFTLALASRTHRPDWAEEVLGLMGIRERFAYTEIYPGSKVPHFQALRKETGIPFGEMIFFDDEPRNIEAVGALGVVALEVRGGLDFGDVAAAQERFAKRKKADP